MGRGQCAMKWMRERSGETGKSESRLIGYAVSLIFPSISYGMEAIDRCDPGDPGDPGPVGRLFIKRTVWASKPVMIFPETISGVYDHSFIQNFSTVLKFQEAITTSNKRVYAGSPAGPPAPAALPSSPAGVATPHITPPLLNAHSFNLHYGLMAPTTHTHRNIHCLQQWISRWSPSALLPHLTLCNPAASILITPSLVDYRGPRSRFQGLLHVPSCHRSQFVPSMEK